MTCFLDANIFLEVLLDQSKSGECRRLLGEINQGTVQAVTSDFLIDSIIMVMESFDKGADEIATFLMSVMGYRGLRIYPLSMKDRLLTTRHMKKYTLNFDDATTIQAMISLDIRDLISFDGDFDRVDLVRRHTPKMFLKRP